MRRVLVILLALSVVAGACTSGDSEASGGLARLVDQADDADADDPGPEPEPTDDAGIAWRDGGDGWQEGYLAVPLDHDDPDGPTIDIAVVRHVADDTDDSLGPLLINPGGPGAAGIEYAYYAELISDDEIVESFDIVGFDPRGTGASTSVTCGDDELSDQLNAADPVPDSPEETAEVDALVEEYAASCESESGDILPYLDTVSTAKDIDLIREALGEEQITWLGFSYGTYLGATYLELFGEHVRAAVLDGAYTRSLTPVELTEGQAVGFERTLDAFLGWCRRQGCDYAGSEDPEAVLFEILDALDERPIPVGDRELTVGLAWTGLIQSLYSEFTWGSLDEALAGARSGKDGAGLLSLADDYNGRAPDGSYDNSSAAFTTISCMDDGPLDDSLDVEAAAAQIVAAAPRIGPVFTSVAGPCDHLEPTREMPQGPWSAPDAPPVLVVATTGDPATPYEWGVKASDELETSTLLTVEGDSHTAYWGGNSCVTDTIDRYLLDLEVPAEGARC